jgi:hypothetical protein
MSGSAAMRTRPMAVLMALTLVGWVGSFAQAMDGALDQIVCKPKPVATDYHEHDCCGHRKAQPAGEAFPFQPAGMPCGDEHPCCVRPIPQNVPSLPSTSNQQPPSDESRILEAATSIPSGSAAELGSVLPFTFHDDSSLSTVLRI